MKGFALCVQVWPTEEFQDSQSHREILSVKKQTQVKKGNLSYTHAGRREGCLIAPEVRGR